MWVAARRVIIMQAYTLWRQHLQAHGFGLDQSAISHVCEQEYRLIRYAVLPANKLNSKALAPIIYWETERTSPAERAARTARQARENSQTRQRTANWKSMTCKLACKLWLDGPQAQSVY